MISVGYKELPLSCGLAAIIDDCDWQHLSQFSWHHFKPDLSKKVWARSRNANKKWVLMHHEVLRLRGLKQRRVIHINGNCLDNRFS